MTSQIKKGEKTKAPSSIKGILNEERHRIVLLRYVKSFFFATFGYMIMY